MSEQRNGELEREAQASTEPKTKPKIPREDQEQLLDELQSVNALTSNPGSTSEGALEILTHEALLSHAQN